MIGVLPTTLTVNNNKYNIRTDYRVCLLIFEALNDVDLNEYERALVLIELLYIDEIPEEDLKEACERGLWFLNCGQTEEHPRVHKPLYNFTQDEQMIFSAVNKVAGREIRNDNNLHFWTFMGYFNEIGEGTFSTIVSIRDKRNKRKKLEKWEQEFYNKHREMVDIKVQLSESDKLAMAELNKILGI